MWADAATAPAAWFSSTRNKHRETQSRYPATAATSEKDKATACKATYWENSCNCSCARAAAKAFFILKWQQQNQEEEEEEARPPWFKNSCVKFLQQQLELSKNYQNLLQIATLCLYPKICSLLQRRRRRRPQASLHEHEAELGLQIRVSSLIQECLVHHHFIGENIIRVTLHFSCTILGMNLSDPSDFLIYFPKIFFWLFRKKKLGIFCFLKCNFD